MISSKQLSLKLKKVIFFLSNLLLVITPFLFTWVNTELFEFNKMMFVYLIVVLITGLWLGRMLIEQKPIFKKTALDWPLLAFVVSQAAAAAFSLHPRTSIFGYYTRFHGGLLSTLSYALIYWCLVSNFNFQQIKILLRSAFLAAIGISLYAIPEKLGVSPSCILIRGEASVNCWVQDVRNRVFATFGQPNWLAAYLGMLIPCGVNFYLNQLQPKQSGNYKSSAGWWLLAAVILWIALLFTNSRSGLLGTALGLLIIIVVKLGRYLFKVRSKKPGKFLTTCKKLSVPLLIFLATLLLIGTDFTPTLGSLASRIRPADNQAKETVKIVRTSARTTADENILITPSEKIRLIVWRGAVNVWRRYPFLGSGPGTFAYSYYLDRPMMHNLVSEWDFLYNKAHNELLNILATSGIIGLAGYLWLAGANLLMGLKLSLNQKKETDINLALALVGGITAFHVTNFLGFSTVMISVLWMLFAAALSLMQLRQKQTQEEKTPAKSEAGQLVSSKTTALKKTGSNTKLSLFQYLTLFMLGLIQLHFIVGLGRIWTADYLYTQAKSKIAGLQYEDGVSQLQLAVSLSPQEALFYDELASVYSQVAAEFYQLEDEQDTALEFAQLAKEASDKALALNPNHLNFHKSRSGIYTNLAAIDPDYLHKAKDALKQAQTLAPTDPKLVYQEGLITLAIGEQEEGISLIEQAIEMKPNYHQARYKLGEIFEDQENYPPALEQYQFILDYLIPGDRNLQEKVDKIQQKIEQN